MSVEDELHVVFGSGPVGLAVVDTLLSQGKRIRVVSRSGARRALPDAVEVTRGDATRPEDTRQVCSGATHVYARQVKEAGRLGLAGFLLFGLMWQLTAAFQFAEGLIVPLLATDAPMFAVGFEGISSGSPSEVSLGILPALNSLTSVLYLVGGVLFGVATFRAVSCRAGPAPGLPSGPLRHSYFRSCCPMSTSGWRRFQWE